ncbi:PolC-type DNA polymerase III [Haliovirga abyssi]|uniref:DNA polymerase III PolC-type n=1 Tax=Haliovirga abyssi TaxID=2996794 RepID=A0AAU9DE35_9FUSO|nr:PolC-type DNA polymerase III [Haliovirga abyssi]BDU50453.1 DNA polymerase III PolC-type [Haliovirga abyssi]
MLVRIKPNKDTFANLGIKNTEIDEIEIHKSKNRAILKCSVGHCDNLYEIEIIKKALSKKFGDKIEFDFQIDLSQEEFSNEDIIKVLDRIILEVKEKTALGKAYFGICRYRVEEDNIKIELKHNIAKEQIEKSNFSSEIAEKFYNITGIKMKIEFVVGDFSKEIEKLDNKKFIPEQKKEIQVSKPKIETTTTKSNDKKKNIDENILFGKTKIKGAAMSYEEFDDIFPNQPVILEGEVFKFEKREISNGEKLLYSFNITNYSNSITIKVFAKKDNIIDIKSGTWVKIKGRKQQDKFSNNEDIVFANTIEKLAIKKKVRKDNADKKRVELHAHTKMSAMDSVIEVKDLIKQAYDWGHKSVAITDHGVVHSFPFAYNIAKKMKDFKVILGVEGYLVDDEIKMVKFPKNIPIEDEEYVVFDLETTGFDPYNDRIIEIGAVKLVGSKIVDRFSQFINPKMAIPEKITELTGITQDMVANARSYEEVIPDFLEFVGDSTVVAHNANFDVGFITQKCKLLGLEFENSVIDTLQWSRNMLKDLGRHNLKALSRYFKISLENHHRAVDDAEATAEIFKKFINMLIRQGVYKLPEIDSTFKTDIKQASTNHIIILVKNQIGLINLYKLISESHLDFFKRTPRIPKTILKKYREGLILSSACEAGELIQGYLRGKPQEELEKIAEFYDYFEIQPNSNNMFLIKNGTLKSVEELNEMNKYICELGEKLNKPVVATGDVHYKEPEDNIYRSILLYGKGFKDYDSDGGLYFKTTNEMLNEFNYLGAEKSYEVVVENSNLISDMIEEVQPIPDGFYPPKIEGAEEQVKEMTYSNAKKMYGDPLPEIVEKRIERELNSIINNGFAVLYLTAQKLVKKSLDDGYLVGSRGSVGSSLVAYFMEITEVNALYQHYLCTDCKYSEFKDYEGSGVDLPDKICPKCGKPLTKQGHSIPFEVFMGFHGEKVPDIDLNFSGEYQSKVHKYTEELFGKENVFKAGTISTLAEKNAFGYVRKFTEENGKIMRKAEMERLAEGCVNVRKTTGQHPGGMIVVPYDKSIYEFTPVQKPANDMKSESITTHFDYHVMDSQLVKLDILGHDDPTTIKLLQEYTGVDIYQVPIADEETLKIFNSTESLGVRPEEIGSEVGTFGVPEFGTKFVRQMLLDTRPTTFAELVRISGLSHGTDVWLNNAQEYIRRGVAKLTNVISVRDDIMNYLIDSGLEKGTAFAIMEFVRKGKPSKDPEKWAEYAKLMKETKVPDWYIESCKKIKYMFPKGHAVAYVMMAMRIAYFKIHYPVAFYAAYLSRKADDINSDTMLNGITVVKQRRAELEKENRLDVKEKSELALLEILTEMHYRGVELLPVDVYKSGGKRFLIEDNKLRLPLIAINGLGEAVVENIIKEREIGKFLSFEDLTRRTKASKNVIEKLKEYKAIEDISDLNQFALW